MRFSSLRVSSWTPLVFFTCLVTLFSLLQITLATSPSQPLVWGDQRAIDCYNSLPHCAPGGPCGDLTVDGPRVQASAHIAIIDMDPSSCSVIEGCSAPGRRTVLRFDMATPNLGTADVFIGNPGVPSLQACFEWSPCHAHYHFQGFAQYLLFDGDTIVARGHKSSSCLQDALRWPNSTAPVLPPSSLYTCANQGIRMGYQDVYGSHLDCQWIDVTGVPPGNYDLMVQVNPQFIIMESNYTNNNVTVPVTIPVSPPDPTPVPTGCDQQGGCGSCVNTPSCGWCASAGYCAYGTFAGPSDRTCSWWSWGPSQCPAPGDEPGLSSSSSSSSSTGLPSSSSSSSAAPSSSSSSTGPASSSSSSTGQSSSSSSSSSSSTGRSSSSSSTGRSSSSSSTGRSSSSSSSTGRSSSSSSSTGRSSSSSSSTGRSSSSSSSTGRSSSSSSTGRSSSSSSSTGRSSSSSSSTGRSSSSTSQPSSSSSSSSTGRSSSSSSTSAPSTSSTGSVSSSSTGPAVSSSSSSSTSSPQPSSSSSSSSSSTGLDSSSSSSSSSTAPDQGGSETVVSSTGVDPVEESSSTGAIESSSSTGGVSSSTGDLSSSTGVTSSTGNNGGVVNPPPNCADRLARKAASAALKKAMKLQTEVTQSLCQSQTSCDSCSAHSECGWCPESEECLVGGASGPSTGTCKNWQHGPTAQCIDCAGIESCDVCTSSKGCGWCGESGTCTRGSFLGANDRSCKSKWTWSRTQCTPKAAKTAAAKVKTNNKSAARVVAQNKGAHAIEDARCAKFDSCFSCGLARGCGWCASMNKCLSGQPEGPPASTCPASEWHWTSTSCIAPPPAADFVCNSFQDCTTCSNARGCGWCPDSNTCSYGSFRGPSNGKCKNWVWSAHICTSPEYTERMASLATAEDEWDPLESTGTISAVLKQWNTNLGDLLKMDALGNTFKSDPIGTGLKKDPLGNFLKDRTDVDIEAIMNHVAQQQNVQPRPHYHAIYHNQTHFAPPADQTTASFLHDGMSMHHHASAASDINAMAAVSSSAVAVVDPEPSTISVALLDMYDPDPLNPEYPHGHIEIVHGFMSEEKAVAQAMNLAAIEADALNATVDDQCTQLGTNAANGMFANPITLAITMVALFLFNILLQ